MTTEKGDYKGLPEEGTIEVPEPSDPPAEDEKGDDAAEDREDNKAVGDSDDS